MDFGAKNNIAKSLNKRGCQVTIYPADTTAEEIIASRPDGIMLSNGPGDPEDCTEIIEEIRKLYETDIPIFAICLGHQLMALATWGRYPQTEIRSQRRQPSGEGSDRQDGCTSPPRTTAMWWMPTAMDPAVAVPAFVNVNDGTNEGLTYVGKNIFTVQFHPEACPGPQDSGYLFDSFMEMMEGAN